MQKLLLRAAAAVISFSLLAFPARAENISDGAPDITSAKAAVLTELSTGQVLWSHNADLAVPTASVTKIMTLLIAAEEIEAGRLSFSDTAVCSAHANSMDGSVIWLREGEEMEIGELIKSIVIASANDACVMLAEHIGGTEAAFAERMNERAAALGLKNTSFKNCTGLDEDGHFSSASDIAVMAKELRRHSCYDEFLLTRLDSVRTGTADETQLLNTNKLITSYSGITGLKTGTTDNAGCCFVGTARRGEMELCAVVMGCASDSNRFDAAESLLDYGFKNFEKITPHPDVSELLEIPVKNGVKSGADTRYTGIAPIILPKGTGQLLEYHYSRSPAVEAPVAKGQTLGFVTMTAGDDIIGTAKIIAAEEVEALDFGKCMEFLFSEFFRF